jgi:hypothetical protein
MRIITEKKGGQYAAVIEREVDGKTQRRCIGLFDNQASAVFAAFGSLGPHRFPVAVMLR